MSAPCPRLFEAEAVRDGRLTGGERVSFERHVAMCPACAREVRALEALGDAVRAETHDGPDELHVRRERMRLLAAFDRVLVAPERRGIPRPLLGGAVTAMLIVGLAVLWRARTGAPRALAPSTVVHADGAALWSEHREGDVETVVLERGALWIHVDHASGGRRLVVSLPDGELEDIGTTFTVTVVDGRTSRVTVQEGRVVLRLRGRPSLLVSPGDTWIPDAPAPVACVAMTPEPAPSSALTSPSVRIAQPLRSAAPVAPAAPDAPADFRAAMDAFDRGDNGAAAREFGRFLENHPRDSRAEDAAYLRVIALKRSGNPGAMHDAAQDYLRRYPAGFRHTEVQRLSH